MGRNHCEGDLPTRRDMQEMKKAADDEVVAALGGVLRQDSQFTAVTML